jgi:hypothetical protein
LLSKGWGCLLSICLEVYFGCFSCVLDYEEQQPLTRNFNSIKLIVKSGVQLKSLKVQLEFDWIRIENQLIEIAFNSIPF